MPVLSDDADSNSGDWSQSDYRTRDVVAASEWPHARLQVFSPRTLADAHKARAIDLEAPCEHTGSIADCADCLHEEQAAGGNLDGGA